MKGKAIYELKERDHRPSNTILIEGERKHRGINPVTSRRVEQYEIMPCLRALLISGKLYSLKAKSSRTATCKRFGIKAGTLRIIKGRPFCGKVWVLTSNHPERSTPFYD